MSVLKYIFGGSTGLTYDDIKRRQQVSDAKNSQGRAPITSQGQGQAYALIDILQGLYDRRTHRADTANREKNTALRNAVFGMSEATPPQQPAVAGAGAITTPLPEPPPITTDMPLAGAGAITTPLPEHSPITTGMPLAAGPPPTSNMSPSPVATNAPIQEQPSTVVPFNPNQQTAQQEQSPWDFNAMLEAAGPAQIMELIADPYTDDVTKQLLGMWMQSKIGGPGAPETETKTINDQLYEKVDGVWTQVVDARTQDGAPEWEAFPNSPGMVYRTWPDGTLETSKVEGVNPKTETMKVGNHIVEKVGKIWLKTYDANTGVPTGNPFTHTDKDGNLSTAIMTKTGELKIISPVPPKIITFNTGTEWVVYDANQANKGEDAIMARIPLDIRGKAVTEATAKKYVENIGTAHNIAGNMVDFINTATDIVESPHLRKSVGFIEGVITEHSPIIDEDRKNFKQLVEQLSGQAFLYAFDKLKGGGQITEREGKAALQAVSTLSLRVDEHVFKRNIVRLLDVYRNGLVKLQEQVEPNDLPKSFGVSVGRLTELIKQYGGGATLGQDGKLVELEDRMDQKMDWWGDDWILNDDANPADANPADDFSTSLNPLTRGLIARAPQQRQQSSLQQLMSGGYG